MKERMKELINNLDRKNVIWLSIMFLSLLIAVGAVIVLTTGTSEPDTGEYVQLAREAHSNPKSFVDFDMLTERNEDTAAWLLSEGTGMDYPVVQGKNNKEYRSRSFSGKKDPLGCLYIDSACAADLIGRNTVIYGGELLAPMYSYSAQDYYELLPSVTLYTPQGKHIISLIAGAYFEAENVPSVLQTDFASDEDFAGYIAGLRSSSCFISAVATDNSTRLVTFCAEDRGGAFVLVGAVQ